MDRHGITPLPDKVACIRNYPQPTSQKHVREFQGILNFYHHFIPNCARLVHPLTSLLSKKSKTIFSLSSDVTEAFQKAKDALANATLLNHPVSDAPTNIMTDASDVAVGAVLQQFQNGHWTPLAYFSKKLTTTERKYSTFDCELLAIYLAVKHFRYFIEGQIFHVITDHKPLTYSLSTNSNHYSPRQIRHLELISQYTTDLRHAKGISNPVADALSRIDFNAITHLPFSTDLNSLARAQQEDRQLQHLQQSSSTSLNLTSVTFNNQDQEVS